MRQGDIEDRIVEPLHDVRQHDRERDHAAVGDRSDRLTSHRSPSRRSLLVAFSFSSPLWLNRRPLGWRLAVDD